MPVILLFMHGWGFDAGFWAALAAELPEWRAACDDRGYFGAPRSPAPEGPCIVVAHSFGAMRALAAPPPGCRGLVAINGFDRFTAPPDAPGVSPRIVDRMIARVDDDPAAVLSDFRRRCGDEGAFGPPDIARLHADLMALRETDYTAASAAWRAPLLSLQGARDPLLPPTMRDGGFSAAPLLERLTHPAGGHLLPVSDAAYCARAIRNFAERAR
jgi:pimeloyl-[acyl-carrier protein] methyl ester esterase